MYCTIVEVVESDLFSNLRDQRKYREFPKDERDNIVSAVEGVPPNVFLDAESGHELRVFDDQIASSLTKYEYEHAPRSDRNPACKFRRDKGFDHSVYLYHPEKRIAIEIEKKRA